MKNILLILMVLIFCSCATSPVNQDGGITPTTGFSVSQISDRQFQIQVWQNPEKSFKDNVQDIAMQQAEKVCQENDFADAFSMLKTEWGTVSKESIILTVQCNKKCRN